MSAIVEQDKVLSLDQAKRLMAEKIKQAHASRTLTSHSMAEPAVARLEIVIDDIAALSWLAAQKSQVKTYWSDRKGKFEMAGIGIADVVTGKGEIDHHLLFTRLNRLLVVGNENLRYYGGLSFNKDVKARDKSGNSQWEDFGSYRFVIPRFELSRRFSKTNLVCNVVFGIGSPNAGSVLDELGGIVSPSESSDTEFPEIISHSHRPDREGWKGVINAALESISTTELEKLVLARQTSFELSVPSNPMQLLQRLKETTSGCYHFGFQLNDNLAFVGAPPEQLYRRTNRMIMTEAVGGTRPRGATVDKDETLGRELLRSEKDLREYRYVAESVQEALSRLCQSAGCVDDLSLLKLPTVQHLITHFRGKLAPGISDADILAAMHPTPAVGGYPVDRAVKRINELEPFDRGWFAGPVGWVGTSAAEFAVAIRSGLVAGDNFHLFAGAGIVKGSMAESEWREIEDKLSSFTKVFVA